LGNVFEGRASGSLLVSVPGGTLTLTLTGPIQGGFAALPSKFSFVITRGTGKFHNRVGDPVGRGTVDVLLKPAAASPGTQAQGGITLVFHPGIVVLE
jgi:hypothetical protein